MQTSKMRNGSSDAPQRTSPVTPKSTRTTKSTGTETNSSTSRLTPTKAQTDRSSKVIERRSPRSPVTSEKKRPSRLTELESQLIQLQEDLKKTKDQLTSSESLKKKAQQDAEDFKQKLETSQNQFIFYTTSEESRLQELRKISNDRDQAWQSELEAIQKQHSIDSSALSSALNEIQRLKLQLEIVVKSEAESLSTVDKLNMELSNSEKAEAEAEAKVVETQQQLEVDKAVMETLRSEGLKLMELFRCSLSELEQSKARVSSLEETVKKLKDDQVYVENFLNPGSLEFEVEQLRSTLRATESKYEKEQIQIASEIHAAYEMAEQVKIESGARESQLEAVLKIAEAELAELRICLFEKENKLQSISDMQLKCKTENQMEPEVNVSITELKVNLLDKENEVQSIFEENELLKVEIVKREVENSKSYESAISEMDLAKDKEKEALLEADKMTQKAERVAEQLEAAKAVNMEMEVELRRLRVQSEQWRKAAEAAAAVLTTGNNGGLDAEYQSVAQKLMHSPFSDDLDLEDDSPKRRNSNVLRKFGGLWKKNPK